MGWRADDRDDDEDRGEDRDLGGDLDMRFGGELWYWRGPSPFHFITVPDDLGEAIRAVASLVTYGWGVIPVRAEIRGTTWKTSLFPKDGRYLVPVKDLVRNAERLERGDWVDVRLVISL
jgi:hypothetical protein